MHLHSTVENDKIPTKNCSSNAFFYLHPASSTGTVCLHEGKRSTKASRSGKGGKRGAVYIIYPIDD